MIIADLQIHSSHSRATSKYISFSNLERYARMKGLHLLGTGDFQHPLQFKAINEELEEDDKGILWTKTKFPFLWQTEISLIYTQDGKGRRIHHLIYAPNKDVAQQIIEALSRKGRLDYDGRPIFGFNSVELVDMMMEISKDIEIVPSHAWTPWYSIFGSMSGFDSVEECFQEKSKCIHAIETGLSSDIEMNRLISRLDKYTLVSNSDSHGFWPWRIGREATVFDCDLDFKKIIKALRTREGLNMTIEVEPSYGKYHLDGHRVCGVVLEPKETKKLGNVCPKCKKPLTIGVLSRVLELADRDEPKNLQKSKKLLPLHELIAAIYGISMLGSTKVWEIYNKLVTSFDNEFNVLLNVSYDDLCKVVDKRLADIIIKNREDKLRIKAGADGVYGQIILDEKEKVVSQKKLTNY